MTTIEQIEAWMCAPSEGEQLELKEAKTGFDHEKLCRYCVAIANEGGGHLVLGVTNKPPRHVVGTQACGNPVEMKRKLLEELGFRVGIDVVAHPRGRVVVFTVPSRPRGHAYEHRGAYLMRAGESLVAMPPDQLRRIFAESDGVWTDRPARTGCDAAEIPQLLVTESYFRQLGAAFPTTTNGVLGRFESEGLVHVEAGGTWTITNLGAVLFAHDLTAFDGLRRKAPRFVAYDGTGKLVTRFDSEWLQGYAVSFEELVGFVKSHTPQNEVITEAFREQRKMFPDIAIRELLANALVHQDFGVSGRSVMIELYSDRIEISSPGRPTVSTERFIDEYRSRNERLADLMRRLGICEEKGSGIDKVVHAIEVFQLPAPDFRAGIDSTTVVLYSHRPFSEMSTEDRVRACYQHCCLKLVLNEKMTNQTLRERFRLAEGKSATVSQIIREAVDRGQIKLFDPNAPKKLARYVPFWA